jgi:two-component system, chemotaxis family, protein-glutamate methylesterase/glutaminase
MNKAYPFNTPDKPPIRVLIVDDSHLVRSILVNMLDSDDSFRVIGQAENGEEGVRMAARLRPDVITMDIRMPRMDGLESTKRIMATTPTPIVVVANSIHDSDYNIAFNAIEAGALTVVEKPRGLTPADYEAVRAQLLTAVRLVAGMKVVARWHNIPSGPRPEKLRLHHNLQNRSIQLIAIASSTGGPGILRQIFAPLPADFSIPIVAVQHITPGFIDHMASWLNDEVQVSVQVAREREKPIPGKVLLAPSDKHLTISPGGLVRLEDTPPVKGQRPSANRLFETVAQTYSSSALGIILTGMGDDGADGLELLGRTGAHIIAQDKETSVIFGMPERAIERGVVDDILSPDAIAETLILLHKQNTGQFR